jgi:hypothetical protein
VDGYVAALLEERQACETVGKVDNVRQIDAELDRLGYAVEKPKPAPRRRKKSTDDG